VRRGSHFNISLAMQMRDLHPKLSVWEKLHRHWEHRHSQPDAATAGVPPAGGEHLCAMEVELRAMNAKADTAFDDAISALHNTAASKS
jgi:hypothetical protein